MRYWKFFISMALVLTFVGCGDKPSESFTKDIYKNGDKIELSSVVGSKLTLLRKNGGFVLAGDENKILILDIFGTFCVPCQEEAPDLMSFQLKNDKDVVLIGFNFLETVTNEYVVDNFSSKFNAYYFIVNSEKNLKMVNTITRDINYKQSVQVPLKVVLSNGEYQNITDIYDGAKDNKFYIGKVDIKIMQKDIDKIKNNQ